MSTSLIHDIVRSGVHVLTHESHVFFVKFPKCNSEIASEFPSYNFENKFLQYDSKNSRHQNSWKIVESVLLNSAVLVSILLLASWQFMVRTEIFLSGAGGFSKTFPEVPHQIPCIVRKSRSAAETVNLGHSRAAPGLRIVKFFLFLQGIQIVLQSPGSETRADSSQKVPLSFFWLYKVHLFSLSSSSGLSVTNSP